MSQNGENATAHGRSHQPDEGWFHAIHAEDIEWKPFPAFPPEARLAILVGDPGNPDPM
jgi:hypothetical protein